MNRVVLIAGVPCTGKTTLGRELRQKGWLHVDAEARSRTVLHDLMSGGDVLRLCLELQRLHHKSVITYGMPVAFMRRVVPELQDAGVECYFLMRNIDEAEQAWKEREGRDPAGPEADQFAALRSVSDAELQRLFGGGLRGCKQLHIAPGESQSDVGALTKSLVRELGD